MCGYFGTDALDSRPMVVRLRKVDAMKIEEPVVETESINIEMPTRKDTVKFILEEARLVLPGIQALFGFQLIVVFNNGFDAKLVYAEQIIHLIAIGLTLVAIALLMAPAAYDRQTGPWTLSDHFVKLSTKFVAIGFIPIVLSMSLDLFLIVKVVTHSLLVGCIAACAALLFFTYFWFVLPLRDGREYPGQNANAKGTNL